MIGRGFPHSVPLSAVRFATGLSVFILLVVLFTPASAADYTLQFGRNLNVWSWDHAYSGSKRIVDKLSSQVEARHVKRVSDFSTGSRQSLNSQANLSIGYAFHPAISLLLKGTAEESRQEAGEEISTVIHRQVAGSFRIVPFKAAEITPYVGAAYDQRRGVADGGVSYGVTAAAQFFRNALAPSRAGLSIQYNLDAVSSKQGDTKSVLAVEARKTWGTSFRQSVSYGEQHDDQKYVSATSGNPILERSTRNRRVETRLEGVVPFLGAIEAHGTYAYGSVRDDASEDRTSLKYLTNNTSHNASGGLSWTPLRYRPSLTYTFTVGRSVRDADPEEEIVAGYEDSLRFVQNSLDRRASTLAMEVSSGIRIGQRDSIRVSGLMSIARDHTPAEDEVNDRDDYQRSLTVGYLHRFISGNSVEFQVERTETHQVWLNTIRSANNKWDRVLNIWATHVMHFGRLSLTQKGFFRTSLEEFDFDYLNPQDPRSRNLRIGRLELEGTGVLSDGTMVSGEVSFEARTSGRLLGATPGHRPDVWQLTSNRATERAAVSVSRSLGRAWNLRPSLSLSRTRTYIPTRTSWHPLHLGTLTDKQEGLSVSCDISFSPRFGLVGGADTIRMSASRTYRRREALTNATNYVLLSYQHAF